MAAAREDFRRAMGRFATGVTIVTTRLGEDLHGMTANAVTSLSLEPLLVLVCVDKTADTHDILSKAGVFAVNILNKDQSTISDRFAKKEFDGAHGLEDLPHTFAVTGAPIIDGALAYLDCRTVTEHHGGDHTIFIGEVVEAKEVSDEEPLVFYRGKYGRLRDGD
jgi:flavin reductase (DIM6/NTAB) family NADH-FMN oxidoreductase RutF